MFTSHATKLSVDGQTRRRPARLGAFEHARRSIAYTVPDGSGPSRRSVGTNPNAQPQCTTQRPSCAPRCGGSDGSAFASTDWRDGPDPSGAANFIGHRRWPKAPDRAGRRRVWPSTDSLVEYEVNQVAGVEGLCFGDLHLARQMKVTRPPGRDPARCREQRPTPRHREYREYREKISSTGHRKHGFGYACRLRKLLESRLKLPRAVGRRGSSPGQRTAATRVSQPCRCRSASVASAAIQSGLSFRQAM